MSLEYISPRDWERDESLALLELLSRFASCCKSRCNVEGNGNGEGARGSDQVLSGLAVSIGGLFNRLATVGRPFGGGRAGSGGT